MGATFFDPEGPWAAPRDPVVRPETARFTAEIFLGSLLRRLMKEQERGVVITRVGSLTSPADTTYVRISSWGGDEYCHVQQEFNVLAIEASLISPAVFGVARAEEMLRELAKVKG